MISGLVDDKRVLVCVGPGGVGKTTTAAAVGALAARRGRRTLVCTIDPAPRLADALGIGGPRARAAAGAARRRCRALGIDGADGTSASPCASTPSGRSSELVNEPVADPEMRRRIFDNIDLSPDHHDADRIAGVRGDAGAARLRRPSGQFDLVVLDTPPTANALDFLDAPSAHRGGGVEPRAHVVRAPAEGGKGVRDSPSSACVRAARCWCAGWRSWSATASWTTSAAFLVDFQDGAGRVSVARPGRRQAAARRRRRLPAGAGARGRGRRRGAVLPRAAGARRASRWAASSPTGSSRRPGLTQPERHRGGAAGATRRSRRLPDGDARGRGRAAGAGVGGVRRAARVGAPRARAPGRARARHRVTEVPLLDHDVDNLAELRVVGDHLSAASPSRP